MARHKNSHNVYVDNDVWTAAKEAGLPISKIVEKALGEALVDAGGYDLEIELQKAAEHLERARQVVREQT